MHNLRVLPADAIAEGPAPPGVKRQQGLRRKQCVVGVFRQSHSGGYAYTHDAN